jgi:hypothetical protein
VDWLRSEARDMVEARTYEALAAAGKNLAAAVQQVGLDRWPRYLADADSRAVAAVSDGSVPGVVKASAADAAAGLGAFAVLGLLALMYQANRNDQALRNLGTPSAASVVQQNAAEDGKPAGAKPAAETPAAPQGGVVIPDDRRKHILDGDGGPRPRGGHGPGRGIPGKSEFPPHWSDDRVIDEIKSVADDPASLRAPGDLGRTTAKGTRDGVDIEVIIGRDGKTVVTAYPTNTPRNPK